MLGAGFASYIVCMIIPQANLTDYWSTFNADNSADIKKWQLIGFAGLILSATALIASGYVKARIDRRLALIWCILILWCGSSSAWSIRTSDTLLYAGLLFVMVGCACAFWGLPDSVRDATATLTSCATVIGIAYLFARLPLGPRSVGGVGANLLAHFGLSIIGFAYIGQARFRSIALVLGICLIAFAQGRTVFIGTTLFLTVYHLILPRIRTKTSLIGFIFAGILIACILALFAPVLSSAIEKGSTAALGVQDQDRTSGSGFSGRTRSWEIGLELLRDHELIGYGFRTRGTLSLAISGLATNAHSGLINAALDIGFVGVLLLSLTYLSCTYSTLKSWAETRSNSARAAGSFLIGMLPILGAEPNYLNFASPSHFLMLIMLARPLVLLPDPTSIRERPSLRRQRQRPWAQPVKVGE